MVAQLPRMRFAPIRARLAGWIEIQVEIPRVIDYWRVLDLKTTLIKANLSIVKYSASGYTSLTIWQTHRGNHQDKSNKFFSSD